MRNAWLEIDLAQFRANLAALQPKSGAKMLLVLKANAYGHGLVRMAREAVASGEVVMLGVGTINEAEELIKAGISMPILVIVPLLDYEIKWCVANGVHFMAWRRDQFQAASVAQHETGKLPKIHLEIDFGMARSGIAEKDFPALIDALDERETAMITGVMAHYAFAAVARDYEVLRPYVEGFKRCVAMLHERGISPIRHVSNSAGTLRFPQGHFDMVRMGATAYGIVSTRLFDVASVVSPIATWKARVTNVSTVEKGSGVNYAWEYIAPETHGIATIGIGYADGFHRHPTGCNTVLLGGVETPVLGRMNMDGCVVRIPDGVDVRVGDEAVLIGRQGDAAITVPQLAQRWGTNGYDVLVGICSRVPRVYVG